MLMTVVGWQKDSGLYSYSEAQADGIANMSNVMGVMTERIEYAGESQTSN